MSDTEASPANVVAHLGWCSRYSTLFLSFQPSLTGSTNSGKTYDALQFLLQRAIEASQNRDSFSAGAFVYAGPLRMLAREVYLLLCSKMPPNFVGLITAEEQINPGALVLSCTTECAPLRGDTLVLDEVHWLVDEERGPAWTRLLASCSEKGFKHLHICGAYEAQALLTRAFPDIQVHHKSRRSSISIPENAAHGISIQNLRSLSCPCAIVAFSRTSVLGLASFLSEDPVLRDRVGVLCGCLPTV
jgi:ATP-dependent RNA helicase SUPV3L1/SUV3